MKTAGFLVKKAKVSAIKIFKAVCYFSYIKTVWAHII